MKTSSDALRSRQTPRGDEAILGGLACSRKAKTEGKPIAMTFEQKKFPNHPAHPERICWGCSRYCPADSMRCGNGSERTQHPVELLGEDWMDFGLDAKEAKKAK
jgi:hypothetical protein